MDARTLTRITLPLACVNALTQAARTIMSTVGPVLALEYGLDAGALGTLSAALFASYCLAQLPAGMALDRWGPRRVQAALCFVAAAGFALFATADSLAGFVLGRLLIGVGVATGLIGMLKGNSEWFAPHDVARVTGFGMVIGTLGSFLATLPAQAALPEIGWRGVIWCCAGAAALVGVWNLLSVRDRPGIGHVRPLRADLRELGRIMRAPAFLRFAPLAALLSVLNFTYLGLWAGPWLRDVAHLGPQARAEVLLVYTLGLLAGGPLTGMAVSRMQRHQKHPLLVPAFCTAGLVVVQALLACGPESLALVTGLWLAFAVLAACGPAAYAAVASEFSASQAGRVSTAINAATLAVVFGLQIVIGHLVEAWPAKGDGSWSPQGYAVGLLITVVFQMLALAWAWPALRNTSVALPPDGKASIHPR